jgi:hypothetical protein
MYGDDNPFPTKLTLPAKAAFSFFVVGILADAFAIGLLFYVRHSSMGGLGVGAIVVASVAVGFAAYVIGALVASGASHRWRGTGERRVAVICLIGIVAGPLAVVGSGFMFS